MATGDLLAELLAESTRWMIAGAMGGLNVQNIDDGFVTALLGAVPLLLVGVVSEFVLRKAESMPAEDTDDE
jgi:hypothetical protein